MPNDWGGASASFGALKKEQKRKNTTWCWKRYWKSITNLYGHSPKIVLEPNHRFPQLISIAIVDAGADYLITDTCPQRDQSCIDFFTNYDYSRNRFMIGLHAKNPYIKNITGGCIRVRHAFYLTQKTIGNDSKRPIRKKQRCYLFPFLPHLARNFFSSSAISNHWWKRALPLFFSYRYLYLYVLVIKNLNSNCSFLKIREILKFCFEHKKQ